MQGCGNRSAPASASDSAARKLDQKTAPWDGRAPAPLAHHKKRPRVQLYLPIADIPVNIFLVLAMGAAVGFVSGMFGIGGGFLMTPLLIFIGIAPAVAVASVASHIAASSFSGAISYWRRRAIDPTLALILLSGGTIGTALGVWTFTYLRSLGQLDLMIGLSYVVLLTAVGGAMAYEGLRAMLRARGGGTVTLRRPGSHGWIHGLPLKMRFKRSKIYLSIIPVIFVGLVIGFIGAIMGIGGGFILVPLMIYLLRVPTSTVIGTSMVLTLVTMIFATLLHAVTNHLVDAVLALILMVGGVTGAQFGARAGQKIRGEHLRLLLGLLVLAVGIRFAVELVIRPADLFTIREAGGGSP
ncbi:putative membrane protein YfcA [Bradyrhizobium sp. USDA 10063]